MFELYKIQEDLYQVHSADSDYKAMEGSLLAIGTYMVHTLEIRPEELEAALLDMLHRDLNAAHFGVARTFIYSFEKQKYKRTG